MPKQLPGIYVETQGTNAADRIVSGTATGVVLINAHKGRIAQRDLVTSAPEFIFKYGTVEQAANKAQHRAAIATLNQGKALYVTRVRAADTAVRAYLQIDKDSNVGGGGGGGGGGGISADRWLDVDLGVDFNLSGAGTYTPPPPSYTSVYSAGTNRSEIQIVMDVASLFGAANKFKIKFTHDTGFPINVDILDESLNLFNTPGYISGTELDLRLSDLDPTSLWTFNIVVLGNATYKMQDFSFCVFGPDADVVEGI